MNREVLVIQPSRGWVSLRLREVWAYRELLYFLAWRDIKVRYTQTVLGAAWAVIQPFFKMVVFTIFFGKLAGIEKMTEGVPYPLFAFAGLVPWQFFEFGLTQSSESLVGSASVIKKVYFPRLIIPLSSVLAGLLDFSIAFVVLLGMQGYYGIWPTANIVFLPAFLLLAIVTSLGVGLWLSALNVQYRDVKYTLGFIVQFWMFSSPIAYPSSEIKTAWVKSLYGLNPMAGVVEGFRWALLGAQSAPGPMIWVSAAAALFIFVSGLYYFRRMERTFADLV
ncbi:MAG TPA: ABC transporter permease [Planctomycetota bacterium]|nr:ABC transporter permease [Planctomycetota bacterium]